jgi:beta-phosphoglucomutase-like phosphatase (HAD superfamily)
MTNSASDALAPADPAAVLWDMDGTLVDTEPYWIRAETELMNAHGLDWSEEQGLEFVGNELTTSAAMMQDAGLDLPVMEIVEILMSAVIAQIRTAVPFRPGALELLAELKTAGIPSVMVTMSYRSLAEAVIASCPPGSFAGLVSGDEVSAGKPDPEPYLRGAGPARPRPRRMRGPRGFEAGSGQRRGGRDHRRGHPALRRPRTASRAGSCGRASKAAASPTCAGCAAASSVSV